MPVLTGKIGGCLSIPGLSRRVGAGGQEPGCHLAAAPRRGGVQRCGLQKLHRIRGGAVGEQQIEQLKAAAFHG